MYKTYTLYSRLRSSRVVVFFFDTFVSFHFALRNTINHDLRFRFQIELNDCFVVCILTDNRFLQRCNQISSCIS